MSSRRFIFFILMIGGAHFFDGWQEIQVFEFVNEDGLRSLGTHSLVQRDFLKLFWVKVKKKKLSVSLDSSLLSFIFGTPVHNCNW